MEIYEKRSAAEVFFTQILGQKPDEIYLVQDSKLHTGWRCRLGEASYISLKKGKLEEYGSKHQKAKFKRVKKGNLLLIDGNICHYKHYTIRSSIGDMCVNKKAFVENAECLTQILSDASSARIKILPLKVLNPGAKKELLNVIWGIYNERNVLLKQFNFVQTAEFPKYNSRCHLLKTIQNGDDFQLDGIRYHAYMEKGLLTLGKFEQLVDIATPHLHSGR